MSTRHRTHMHALVALLLMLALPYVHAADTISLSSDITLVSKTLDGTVLDASAAATATATVNVLLQQCTVKDAGLTVSAATTIGTAGSNPITIRILDTTVADATLTFNGFTPGNSLVQIVGVDATMEGSTPLFNLQNFYLHAGSGSSILMQRVRATWNSAPGGSVMQLGGSKALTTLSGKVFSLYEAVVTGAAHVLELVAGNSCSHCVDTNGGLNAFDLVEFHEPRGAFVYSGVVGYGFPCSLDGMLRFSNITIFGDQAFLEAENAKDAVVYNYDNGNIVFSGITTGGSMFDFKDDRILVSASGPVLKYTFRHINVKAVMSSSTYTNVVPTSMASTALSTWDFHMGNVTVDGTLRETIDELNAVQLFPTQVMDAYGNVQEVAGSPYPTVDLNTPTAAYCVTNHYDSVTFVDLVPGVQRAECDCATGYYKPYCTTPVDPLVYYDAYSPSPTTCGVDNCDTCVSGQTSQCSACALGYMLTNDLGCDKIPCDVANCNLCATDNVCGSCAAGYVLTVTNSCTLCTVSNCNQCASPGDGTKCGSCAAGYVLTVTNSCTLCTVSNCNQCASPGDGTKCDSCAVDYALSDDKSQCKKTTTTTTTTPTTTTTQKPRATYAAAKHTSPELPTYAIVLTIVGLLMSAVPLIIVIVCLVRVHRLRKEETARRRAYMEQWWALQADSVGSGAEAETALSLNSLASGMRQRKKGGL